MYTNTHDGRVTILADSGLYKTRQSYDQTVTLLLDNEHRIRVTIHRDTYYGSQSRFVAQLWDGSRWNEVAHVPPLSDRGGEMVSTLHANEETLVADANEMIDHLVVDQVIPILTTPNHHAA